MGRADPLTVMALGRSPYDDGWVEGEGEEDPRVPPPEYDDKGRLTNANTKRVNREIIRAHNEVMLVIGVAEPESAGLAAALEARKSEREHRERDAEVARMLWTINSAVTTGGTWGVIGMRQRILLYKQYVHVPFVDLIVHERQRLSNPVSVSNFFLAGLPAVMLTDTIISGLRTLFPSAAWHKPWARRLQDWITRHVRFFAILQRLGLIPATYLLPWPSFFVPFMSRSLLGVPLPPLSTLNGATFGRWLLDVGISFAPVVMTHVLVYATAKMRKWLEREIVSRIPRPAGPRHICILQDEPSPQSSTSPQSTPPPPPPPPPPQPTEASPPAPTSEEQPPATRPRRPSSITHTHSHPHPHPQAPEDEAAITDDEAETEGPSAPVISFDVEATDATDAPAGGAWSAELRPTPGPGAAAAPPTYHETRLTLLPARLATHIFSHAGAALLMIPVEAVCIRLLAGAWCKRVGLNVPGMYNILDWRSLVSLGGVTNILGISFMRLIIDMEIWAGTALASQWFYVTPEEWSAGKGRKLAEAGTS